MLCGMIETKSTGISVGQKLKGFLAKIAHQTRPERMGVQRAGTLVQDYCEYVWSKLHALAAADVVVLGTVPVVLFSAVWHRCRWSCCSPPTGLT